MAIESAKAEKIEQNTGLKVVSAQMGIGNIRLEISAHLKTHNSMALDMV